MLTRRRLLGRGASIFGALGFGLAGGLASLPLGCRDSNEDGPLGPPDAHGLRLLPGFEGRVIAVTGEEVAATGHVWHRAPDGGATFETGDGGWIYVSNSELASGAGGVGAIRFDAAGEVVAAYSILTGTSRNCGGGPTPWNTWLSCEEHELGLVFECDPFKPGSQGVARPALGRFVHEAAAVDPEAGALYLTEDRADGLLYRFTPASYSDLSAGVLEAATIAGPGPIAPGEVRALTWTPVRDPAAGTRETRHQAPAATPFDGGEGCWYESGVVTFSTKGDDRVWQIDTRAQQISILYDRATSKTPILSGVDNVFVAPGGDVYVAEDPGEMQIVVLSASGGVTPLLQITGQWGSEVTGPALSPDGTRLYFSSQRLPGTTYEVRGPFLGAARGRTPASAGVR